MPSISSFNILFLSEVRHNMEVKTVANFRFIRTLNHKKRHDKSVCLTLCYVSVCHRACYSSPPCPFLSCVPLSTPTFPCVRECFVYFRELAAQVTFRRRKQCGGIPGNFLPLVSLNTEVYIGQNQSDFCFSLSLSLSLALSRSLSLSRSLALCLSQI